MKALTFSALKKKTEAFDLIKKALFKNLGNFTCWHVYGLLHRQNKNWDEARKAYLNALKYDKENQNVLRDLGQLQITLRDYMGYKETRRLVLVAKPTININWLSFAVANVLCKNYARALEVLDSFEKTLTDNKEKLKNHERSELTLFKAKIYEEQGEYKKAITLIQKKGLVFDQTHKYQRLANCYQKLGEKDKAIKFLELLLELNNSNFNYYYQILSVHGFDNKDFKYNQDEQQRIQEIIGVYEQGIPKSNAHQRVLLKILTGDLFKAKLYAYSRPLIVKGVPPLITDLKEIYQDQEKTQILQGVLHSHIKSMDENCTLHGDDEEQDPTVYLWLLYFTAQHYYQLRDYDQALTFINRAIEHTPTVIDLYVVKARIFKRAGDHIYASKLFEEARQLDLADRYLNAVSSRYLIRVEKLQEAEDVMGLFSKEGPEGLNVHDMQCMWYENEVGLSHLRQGNYRMALKMFNYIDKHLEQIWEDQSDFHLFAMRKYTLNSYFQMLEMEDNIYRNPHAVRAAIGIIKTMSKVSKKAEEEQKRFEPEYEEYKQSKEYKDLVQEQKKKNEDDDEFKRDFDPSGFELYEKSLKDPIQTALDFASQVADANPDAKELQAKIIPLYLKKNKLLNALKALMILDERHSNYQKSASSKIIFVRHWLSLSTDQVKQAIPDEKNLQKALQDFESLNLKDEDSLNNLLEDHLKNNSHSIEHVHEYIKARYTLFGETNSQEKFEQLTLTALEHDSRRNFKVYQAANTLRRLVKAGSTGEKYRTKAKELFKYAKCFD